MFSASASVSPAALPGASANRVRLDPAGSGFHVCPGTRVPSMLHESTQQLIRKLYELTSADSLAWTEAEHCAARLETEGYVVEIAAAPPSLRLLRADGRELETAPSDVLAAVNWPSGDGTYATRVTEMASRAQRIARGAEQAIATILSSLSPPPTNLLAEATAAFGQTASFAKAASVEGSTPSPKSAQPDMLAHGISLRLVQGVEQSTPASFERLMQAAPKPQPTPRLPASGPNVYKPWN
jgi:hypothetical protein